MWDVHHKWYPRAIRIGIAGFLNIETKEEIVLSKKIALDQEKVPAQYLEHPWSIVIRVKLGVLNVEARR